jgi:hypothetical protein
VRARKLASNVSVKPTARLRSAGFRRLARGLARYAKHNANFVLVVSGSLKAKRTKKLIEIIYNLLIKAIELGSFGLREFGVRPVGLK